MLHTICYGLRLDWIARIVGRIAFAPQRIDDHPYIVGDAYRGRDWINVWW